MNKTKDVLVIVPVFNEFKNITSVVDDLRNFFDNIVVVDDGSTDDSLKLIDNLGLTRIRHLLNLGQGAAIESGFNYFLRNTNYKYAITFDGDGQNRAVDAFKMLEMAQKDDLEAVLGSRFLDRKHLREIPLQKKIVLRMARFYESFFYSIKLTDAHNGLRVLKRNLIKETLLPINNHDMSHASEISYKLCKSNSVIKEFPVKVTYNDKRTQHPLNSINIVIKNLLNPF